MELKGLRKICGETKSLLNFQRNNGAYLQLNYNMETHELWTDLHCSLGHNSWTQYHDDNIVTIGFIDNPMTMKEIEQLVERKLKEMSCYNSLITEY